MKNARDLRRQRNNDVVRRMRNGEALTSFDSKASWYPPRPIIEKDKKEMARLYQASAPRSEAPKEAGNVVRLAPAPQQSRPYDEAS